MVCYRADDVIIRELPTRKCDCGAECTQCTSCAQADWQAQNTTCKTCCPVRGERAPLTLQDAADAVAQAWDAFTSEGRTSDTYFALADAVAKLRSIR